METSQIETSEMGAVLMAAFPHQEMLDEPLQHTPTRNVPEVGWNLASQPACLLVYLPVL